MDDTAPEDTGATMAAMGMSGFGSTKVCKYSVVTNARLIAMEGQAGRRESGGRRKREEGQNLEAIYESVCDKQHLLWRTTLIIVRSRGGFNRSVP
jgi:hypothetical protein